ncbi:MAG TPA: transcription-repair coupling factor [Candidatus Methylomirabilis sp.]|nr:transcription-repair coupling factor [Candidatus Methylomirabilis sp.]
MPDSHPTLAHLLWREFALADLFDRLEAPDSVLLHGVHGPARALTLAACQTGTGRTLLVVCRSDEVAATLAADLGFFLGDSVALLPEREADPEARAGRVLALHRLQTGQASVLVASVAAALPRTIAPPALAASALCLYPQRIVPRDELLRVLTEGGYRAVGQVTEPGEFAVRGGIVDCSPPQLAHPVRIEFFGDQVDSLRQFDAETQRSLGPLPQATILPLAEVPMSQEAVTRAAMRLRSAARRHGVPLPAALAEALEQRRPIPEWDAFLPYFVPDLATLHAHLPANTLIVWDEPAALADRARALLEEAEAETSREPDLAPLFPTPADRWLTWSEFQEAARARPGIALESFAPPPGGAETRTRPQRGIPTASVEGYQGRIAAFLEGLDAARRRGERIILVARSDAQGQRMQEILRDHDLGARLGRELPEPGGIALWTGNLSAGFRLAPAGVTIITEAEIFGARALPRRRAHPKEALPFTSFEDLKVEDYVVHVDHGIARYLGLQQIAAGGQAGDFLHLQYAGTDTLYVPVGKLHLVQRYVAGDSAGVRPALDRLGGTSWAKAKERVRASVREMAEELLKLYAARQILPGHPFAPDAPWQKEFEAAFPYEETPDQLQAIRDVTRDLEAPRPMDRLVCGDVGYGKTEVALRAAFKAVMDGKQVAVLVPTTVLAFQHHQTFSARFANFPVKVEMLSRFRPPAEQRQALRDLAEGSVDIVIGTHRLLQKDVKFAALGLLVVDEEQRFGVAAKEALKQLRREVDVLTLTATPIPRTLHMTMLGVRDVSTIETPPEERLAIRTYVTPYDPQVITEAIQREIARGGQVFFVHNRVESIHAVARRLKQLVPEARIAVAHGQQGEAALEKVMVDFYLKKVDVLLCTTIIESGLDVPSANTIIIDRADTLGLAQLYQLRGRVGRDKYRAYAYLLVPAEGGMTEVARKRLQVIAELTELGSGFKIASRDLEIRGAGNLLGAEQSGHIAAVGFDLYTQLIQETVRELKGQPVESVVDPTIRLQIEGFIPEAYVPDASVRLNLYKRLAAVTETERLPAFAEELADRFGPAPGEVERLLRVMELKIQARALRIREIDARREAIRVTFAPSPPVSPETILSLLRSERGRLKYLPEDTLEYRTDAPTPEARIEAARKLLQRLQTGVTVR